MNLRQSKVLWGVLLICSALWGEPNAMQASALSDFNSELLQAYNTYTTGLFTESFNTYKTLYSKSSRPDALYGMINSLVMLQRYNEALALCSTNKDPILTAKKAWILGLSDRSREAKSILSTPDISLSSPEKAMILRSGADGFYSAGNFKEAISWYEQAQQINDDSLTAKAIKSAESLKKQAVVQTISLMGGPIIYSNTQIFDQGDRYRYAKGSYFDLGSRWDGAKRSIELHFNRFDASFQENRLGMNRLYTSLDNSQDFPWTTSYNLHDSLDAWNSEDSRTNWTEVAHVLDTVYLGESISDTTWLLYKDISLLNTTNSDFDTIIRYTPESIFQNALHGGITLYSKRNHPIIRTGSANIFASNMDNMNLGTSLHAYDGHLLNHITLGTHLYASFTKSVMLLQVSPELSVQVKKFSAKVIPAYAWKAKAPDALNIPGVQLSAETEVGFSGEHSILTGSIILGRRAFVGESNGQNLVTVTLPHRVSGSLYGAIMPGSGRVSIFTLLRYENYEQLSRTIALGGVAVTF